jgi:hypothetical protein
VPTVVALTNSEEKGKYIGERMVEAFLSEGGLKTKAVSRLDRVGARVTAKDIVASFLDLWVLVMIRESAMSSII